MTTKAENPITTELAKQNVTEAVIAKLKKDFLPLKINGVEDKEGYKKVHDARIVCRDTRILAEKICKKGREEAIKIQKEWLAKEKEVVNQVSEVEQYLKKQEDAIDTEIENREIRAERLLKLPGRKEQMKGIESYLGELTDEMILRHDDSQWNEVIVLAQGMKLAKQQKEIDDANAKKLLERTIARENELIALGATLYSDGLGKVYRKGTARIEEKTVRDCIEEGWPKIVEVFKNVVISEHVLYPRSASQSFPSAQKAIKTEVVKDVSDEEKLFFFGSSIEIVTIPPMTTDEGKKVLAEAMTLINQAIFILRK